MKYFSGTATYSKQLKLSPGAPSGERRLYLDLGWVHVIAQVRLNDKDLGLLWKPPFRVDITAAARRGDNKLEVLVTNQWVNRLIGDEQLPPENEYGARRRHQSHSRLVHGRQAQAARARASPLPPGSTLPRTRRCPFRGS